MAIAFARTPGLFVPSPMDTISGSKAPAGGFFRFYPQGQGQLIMVDHTMRNPIAVAGGRAARYGNGRPTPWGSQAPVFTGATAFQVPAVGPLSGLTLLGNTASTGWTIWGWCASDPNSAATTRTVWINGASGGYAFTVNVGTNNGGSMLANTNYGGTNAQGGTTLTAAQIQSWNMFAFTFSNKTGKGYINGEHQGSDFTGSGTPVAEVGNLFIGGGGPATTDAAPCALDHVAIDTRPYTAQEIRELYRNPFQMFTKPRIFVRGSSFNRLNAGFFFH